MIGEDETSNPVSMDFIGSDQKPAQSPFEDNELLQQQLSFWIMERESQGAMDTASNSTIWDRWQDH